MQAFPISNGMKLLKVVPITKGFTKELLYFSMKDVEAGALVTIPLRKKLVPALVIDSGKIEQNKNKLRLSPYPLKRITGVKTPRMFSPSFIKAARKIADYFLTDTGNVIKELCPQIILDNPPASPELQRGEPAGVAGPQTSLLQESRRERIKFYKNLVRAEFARNHSIFLCLPSGQKVEYYEAELKKGIEQYIISLHGKMKKTKLEEKWAKALAEKHALLRIATGLFLSLPRADIKTIIVDDESSGLYKSKNRPFLDIRKVAEILSSEMKIQLVLADEIASLGTYQKKRQNEINLLAPASTKIVSQAKETVVDARQYKTSLTGEMKEMLVSASKKNEHTLLFLNRRGYELSTVCQDCGHVLSCIKCETPLVLHKNEEREFLCHKCFLKIKTDDQCPYCKSWKLKTLGFGIQKLAEEVKTLFPAFKIFRLDSDAVKTEKQGKTLINNYLNSPGSILLATEMLFSFYEGEFDRTGVVSVDGLFNIPDFGINERAFRLLIRLKMAARKTFLVQTRLPENPLFANLLKGDVLGFFRSELMMREKLNYPPYKMLIKISREDKNKEKLNRETRALEQKLAEYKPESFAAFTPKVKNNHRSYIVLRLEPLSWPDKQRKLHELLSSLPFQWKVEIAPESLL